MKPFIVMVLILSLFPLAFAQGQLQTVQSPDLPQGYKAWSLESKELEIRKDLVAKLEVWTNTYNSDNAPLVKSLQLYKINLTSQKLTTL